MLKTNQFQNNWWKQLLIMISYGLSKWKSQTIYPIPGWHTQKVVSTCHLRNKKVLCYWHFSHPGMLSLLLITTIHQGSSFVNGSPPPSLPLHGRWHWHPWHGHCSHVAVHVLLPGDAATRRYDTGVLQGSVPCEPQGLRMVTMLQAMVGIAQVVTPEMAWFCFCWLVLQTR